MNAWLNSRKLTLDALKTVFVLFSRKESFFPDLSIVVNLVRIAPAQTVQILDGLVLDANLKWMVHLKSKCVSTKRAILMANSCPRKSFGFDGNRLRFLFYCWTNTFLRLLGLATRSQIKGWWKYHQIIPAFCCSADNPYFQNRLVRITACLNQSTPIISAAPEACGL